MRSFIILEVQHGEDTDDLEGFAAYVADPGTDHKVEVLDWSVRVDLPPYLTAVSLSTHGLPPHTSEQSVDYAKGMSDKDIAQELIDMDAFDAWLDDTRTLPEFYNFVMDEAAKA